MAKKIKHLRARASSRNDIACHWFRYVRSFNNSWEYLIMRDSKIKYKSKQGHEVIHYRLQGTKAEHKSDLEKIKKEIDLKFGFNAMYKKSLSKINKIIIDGVEYYQGELEV